MSSQNQNYNLVFYMRNRKVRETSITLKKPVSFGTAEDRNVRMSASTLNTEILEEHAWLEKIDDQIFLRVKGFTKLNDEEVQGTVKYTEGDKIQFGSVSKLYLVLEKVQGTGPTPSVVVNNSSESPTIPSENTKSPVEENRTSPPTTPKTKETKKTPVKKSEASPKTPKTPKVSPKPTPKVSPKVEKTPTTPKTNPKKKVEASPKVGTPSVTPSKVYNKVKSKKQLMEESQTDKEEEITFDGCTYFIPPKRTIEDVEAMGKEKVIEEAINLAPGGEGARYLQYIKRWYTGYALTITDIKEIGKKLEDEGKIKSGKYGSKLYYYKFDDEIEEETEPTVRKRKGKRKPDDEIIPEATKKSKLEETKTEEPEPNNDMNVEETKVEAK